MQSLKLREDGEYCSSTADHGADHPAQNVMVDHPAKNVMVYQEELVYDSSVHSMCTEQCQAVRRSLTWSNHSQLYFTLLFTPT